MNGQTALSPAQVIIESARLINAGDIEASLTYFADDAVYQLVGLPPNLPDTYAGKEQLRAWCTELAADHFEIQINVVSEEGNVVTSRTLTWNDMTRNLGIAPLVATEVYVIEGGKIKRATWTLSPESQAKMQAAMPKP